MRACLTSSRSACTSIIYMQVHVHVRNKEHRFCVTVTPRLSLATGQCSQRPSHICFSASNPCPCLWRVVFPRHRVLWLVPHPGFFHMHTDSPCRPRTMAFYTSGPRLLGRPAQGQDRQLSAHASHRAASCAVVLQLVADFSSLACGVEARTAARSRTLYSTHACRVGQVSLSGKN